MPLQLPNGQEYKPGQPPEPAEDAPPIEAVPDGAEFPEGAVAPIPCVTAFIVYQLPDGRWQVSDDLDAPLVPERKAHLDDFTSGCATSLRDTHTQELINTMANTIGPAIVQNTVQNVMNNLPQAMMNFGQAVRQQGDAAKVTAQLAKDEARRAGRG